MLSSPSSSDFRVVTSDFVTFICVLPRTITYERLNRIGKLCNVEDSNNLVYCGKESFDVKFNVSMWALCLSFAKSEHATIDDLRKYRMVRDYIDAICTSKHM